MNLFGEILLFIGGEGSLNCYYLVVCPKEHKSKGKRKREW